MKRKSKIKRLNLKKVTIVNLSYEDQKKIKGGSGTNNALTCSLKGSGTCPA